MTAHPLIPLTGTPFRCIQMASSLSNKALRLVSKSFNPSILSNKNQILTKYWTCDLLLVVLYNQIRGM